MKSKSIWPSALILGLGVIATAVALVLSFVPFSTSGTVEPTAAMRAQKSLDEVVFKLLGSKAVKFTGKVEYSFPNNNAIEPATVEFTDLIVTTSNNAQGTIKIGNNQGEYRQIGNRSFLSAGLDMWNGLLTDGQKEDLDLTPAVNNWSDASYTTLPNLGTLLSPNNLGGKIANTETALPADQQPKLDPALQLAAPNKDLPDARFWPSTDPAITFVGDNVVKVGTSEVTFDPSSKAITHIKGDYEQRSLKYTIDADVTVLPDDQAQTLFGNQQAILDKLVSVPLPGLRPLTQDAPLNQAVVSVGIACDASNLCSFNVVGTGANASDYNGHFNYGVNGTFTLNNARVPGVCNVVVRADFGKRGQAPCSTRVNGGGTVRLLTSFKYLAFRDASIDQLKSGLEDTQKRTQLAVDYVRTGHKQLAAALYGATYITGLPSFIGVKYGNYLFDGADVDGGLAVVFSPGYAEHVSDGTFDSSWSGTQTIKDQLKQQVDAAGDKPIRWYTAEDETRTALIALISDANQSSKVAVVYLPLDKPNP